MTLDVERALRELEAADAVTDDDLQAFKERLPTDPQTARLVDAALPFPWSDVFEYVQPGDRANHWRVTPARDHPNQVRAQERFAEASREAAGTRGTVERDGQVIPKKNAAVADAVAEGGTDAGAEDPDGVGQKALSRLRDVLGV